MPFSRWKYSTATINSPFINVFFFSAAHPGLGEQKSGFFDPLSASPINQPAKLYAIPVGGQALIEAEPEARRTLAVTRSGMLRPWPNSAPSSPRSMAPVGDWGRLGPDHPIEGEN